MIPQSIIELSIKSSMVPFEVARQFLEATLDTQDHHELQVALRPILHTEAPPHASLSDRQAVDTQLRFYTQHRCLRDFRQIGWKLAAKYRGAKIIVDGNIDAASDDFFRAISDYFEVTIEKCLSRDAHGGQVGKHELSRLLSYTTQPDGWHQLNRIISTYLNCGDSWTAVWIAEALLRQHKQLPSFMGDTLGLAFGLQDQTTEAESMFLLWRKAGSIDHARANYSLAMLYARHHPTALRDDGVARQYLDEAWNVLTTLDDANPQVIYERVFNRNGLALILYRHGQNAEAAILLENSIAQLMRTSFHSGVHHTVLLNNLGRVYAALGDAEKAERTLKTAIDLDPGFAEYWFDLASFLCDQERLDDALDAAVRAESCSSTIAEIPALIGYIEGLRGNFAAAAQSYVRAWLIEPDKAEFTLCAAHYYCEAQTYINAGHCLEQLNRDDLSLEQHERFDLLQLDVDMNRQDALSVDGVQARLCELARRHPNSKVICENIEAYGQVPAR